MTSSTEGPTSTDAVPSGLLDDRYSLESLLGRGGMGNVYRALDTRLDRMVAVKVLSDAPGADGQRFQLEVRTLARFTHTNLVRLLDAGDADGRLFLVMDLIEGTTLATRLFEGPLSQDEAAKVGAGIAAALAYVHREGVVHRDIKPANILLDQAGIAHLADFGIARLVDTTGLTRTGLTIGTPAYLAPEQVQGELIGPPADVYALGLVLLECLTGRRAFSGTAAEITAARLQRNPEIPSELDANWRDVLASMTTRTPGDRIGAAAVATMLEDRAARPASVPAQTIPTSTADPTVAFASFDVDAPATQRLDPALRTLEQTRLAPVGRGSPVRDRRWAGRSRPAILAGSGLGLVALILGLAFGGVLAGSSPSPTRPLVTTTTATTATSTSTSTSTTTTLATPSAGTAASRVIAAVQAGVNNGTVSAQAGQQLVGQLTPLLFSAHPEPVLQQTQQFDQLAQSFEQAITRGQITGTATIDSLTGSLKGLATALGTTVPSATTTTTMPKPPGKHGKGHDGHGKGNGD